MPSSGKSLWSRILAQREVRRWHDRAAAAETEHLSLLRAQRVQAMRLREELDHLIHVGNSRLMLPMIGFDAVSVPAESDWVWRPELWRGPLAQIGIAGVRSGAGLGEEVTLFHDCMKSEVTLRQLRNSRESDLAPFGLRMDILNFGGSFLSIVVELPQGAVRDLRRRHVLRLDLQVEMEKRRDVYVRLNIQHGPNTEQLTATLPVDDEEPAVEFDLAYSAINEKRIEKAWVDVIFDKPAMNEVVLRDMTFSRRARADL